MKRYVALLAVLAIPATQAAQAEDTRQLVQMPAAAEANLRTQMREDMRAINEILSLVAEGKFKEAGAAAEKSLGQSVMGRYRSEPFEARPGPHMPPAMHAIAIEGHRGASEFARIAATGDRDKTLAALPSITAPCVGCHHAYRIR